MNITAAQLGEHDRIRCFLTVHKPKHAWYCALIGPRTLVTGLDMLIWSYILSVPVLTPHSSHIHCDSPIKRTLIPMQPHCLTFQCLSSWKILCKEWIKMETRDGPTKARRMAVKRGSAEQGS
jgi:hypothetical protein